MKYGRFKKAVSGFLAAMTIMTTVFSPLSAYAAEVPPEEPKPPLYEEVKDQLDVDEVVKAEDLELEYGCNFDVKTDFSNIEIPDNEKVKVKRKMNPAKSLQHRNLIPTKRFIMYSL